MLKRTVFGLIAAAFGICILVFRNTPALVVTLALLAAVAAREIEKVVNIKNKAIFYTSIVFAALVPFYYEYKTELAGKGIIIPVAVVLTIYIVMLFMLMLTDFENTKFQDVATVIIASVFVPWAFSTLIMLRDVSVVYPEKYDAHYGLFFLLLGLFTAWLTDTFAYFTGRFLGKHKLCPNISPKKTVEGAIGGLAGGIITSVILFAVFDNYFFTVHSLSYVWVIIVSAVLSVIGMCGDLTASVVKRNFGVKDYGNILPGHGGVMDRFDSGLFVLASLYALITVMGTVC